MIGKIYFYIIELIISFVDLNNKRTIIKFFKDRLQQKSINIVDMGAHKGETINLFLKNFKIN